MADGERRTGRFITFEGPEGAGKSLQARRLAERLREAGREVVLTREPGGTPAAETLRGFALETPLHPRSELLVFLAARAEHVEALIRPALERGAVVICDRFIDSTVAYQGYGLGLDPIQIRSLNAYSTDGLAPDQTLVLDVPPEVGFARRGEARQDQIERRDDDFHARLREGFLSESRREPDRIHVLDGTQDPDAITELIWSLVEPKVPM